MELDGFLTSAVSYEALCRLVDDDYGVKSDLQVHNIGQDITLELQVSLCRSNADQSHAE